MTGWRIAYAAGPADLIAAMTKIHQYTMLAAPIMAQKAALEACRSGEPEMEAMVRQYDERRRFFVKGLNEIGLETLRMVPDARGIPVDAHMRGGEAMPGIPTEGEPPTDG